MDTEMTTLTAATATATVIIEPENLSRIDGLPLPRSVLLRWNSRETKQSYGSVFQYSPIARSGGQSRVELHCAKFRIVRARPGNAGLVRAQPMPRLPCSTLSALSLSRRRLAAGCRLPFGGQFGARDLGAAQIDSADAQRV